MKKIILLLIILSNNLFSQTFEDAFNKGVESANNQDLKSAINYFSKAIQINPESSEAYYSRGTIKMNLKDYQGAIIDFNKTISLDDKFVKAYYNRAGIMFMSQKLEEALPDMNKVIELDETFPEALTVRGQIKFFLKDEEGACKDFNRAKEIGDKNASQYISKFCGQKNVSTERYTIDWSKKPEWKIAEKQENEKMVFIELLKDYEKFENWTEISTMITYKGVVNEDVEDRAKMLYDQTKEKFPKAKLKVIELNKSVEFPSILFIIECPVESQLWYIVQGNSSMYLIDWAMKKSSLPKEEIESWAEFFKSGKIESK